MSEHLELAGVWQYVEVRCPIRALLPLNRFVLEHDHILVVKVRARRDFEILRYPQVPFCPFHGALVLLPRAKLFVRAHDL